ncbi:UdgX family uracil-DNA binding protein [Bartonella sp. LJL80]
MPLTLSTGFVRRPINLVYFDMKIVSLQKRADFNEWRDNARQLLERDILPEQIDWNLSAQSALFHQESPPDTLSKRGSIEVPRRFLSLAELVLCYSSEDTPALLYRLLYRLQTDKQLLQKLYDRDVSDALSREKSVRRDIHHMHAFLRFKESPRAGERRNFTAWYEPDHFIVERAAPFFCRRFSDMDWQILTPKGSLRFEQQKLTIGPAVANKPNQNDDAEDLWKTYFSHIFNPARMKIQTMQSHMPKKFWHNLPETAMIGTMIAGAETRVKKMHEQQAMQPPLFHQRLAKQPVQEDNDSNNADTLPVLNQNIQKCQRCPLHCYATQAVCGEGNAAAKLMVVGEQPGDREDLIGRPFSGPAGQLFNRTCEQVGLDRSNIYLTNAVKHFKYEMRGKRRMHKTANRSEIQHCRWWLLQEIALVKPKLIVTMGATALFSLTGNNKSLTEMQGKIITSEELPPILPTIHPSYLLRLQDKVLSNKQEEAFARVLKYAVENTG